MYVTALKIFTSPAGCLLAPQSSSHALNCWLHTVRFWRHNRIHLFTVHSTIRQVYM